MKRWFFILTAILFGWTPMSTAQAQAFELDLFRPSKTTQEGFAINTADDQGHLRVGTQLYLDYADDPLVFDPGIAGVERAQVVHRQLRGNLNVSLGVWERLVVYASLAYDFVLKESGDALPAGGALDALGIRPTGSGLGDLSLGARGRIWGERDDLVQLAAQVTLFVHTASAANSAQNYRGGPDESPRLGVHPEMLATFNVGDDVRISANLGYNVINDVLLPPDRPIGDTLTFGAGVIGELVDDRLALIGELYGRTAFSDRKETPIEFLVGAKYHHDIGLTFGVGGGAGISSGIGAPDYRLLGMVGYAMPEESTAVFTEPEAPPPADSDGDGIVDEDDACPTEAGLSAHQGCPDTDGDGIVDTNDQCPTEPGPAVTKGCPDPDRDADEVPDRVDNCPDEPGTQENRGCLKPQLVEIHYDQLAISKKVYFPTGGSRIQRRSFALLDNVAEVLLAHPEILLVKVEGHADPRGSEAENLDLSRRRAESVARYLVSKGVAEERLITVERGEAVPERPDAVTDEEHEANRRVLFKIFARATNVEHEIDHIDGEQTIY